MDRQTKFLFDLQGVRHPTPPRRRPGGPFLFTGSIFSPTLHPNPISPHRVGLRSDCLQYVVVKGALSPADVAALDAGVSARIAAECADDARHNYFGLDLGDAPTQPRPAEADGDRRARRAEGTERDLDTARMLSWGPEFVDQIDNAAVRPVLEDALGPGFRLDHACKFLAVSRQTAGRPRDWPGYRWLSSMTFSRPCAQTARSCVPARQATRPSAAPRAGTPGRSTGRGSGTSTITSPGARSAPV